ncbi:hypothetical protein GCM10027592_63200 [Spirosoma flavus]
MRGLVTDIKQLRRRKIAEPVAEVINPDIDLIEVSQVATPRLSAMDSALERMKLKNPALSRLISTLDLEPTGLETPPGYARVWELAGQALSTNTIYTRGQVIARIQNNTGISQDRAERGFAMMLESKAIESTIDAITGTYTNEQFYLGGSTPF